MCAHIDICEKEVRLSFQAGKTLTIFLAASKCYIIVHSYVLLMKNRILRDFSLVNFFMHTKSGYEICIQAAKGLRYHWANESLGQYLVLISKATWWLLHM